MNKHGQVTLAECRPVLQGYYLKGNIADEAIKAVFRVVVERQEETAAREAAEAAALNGTFMFEPLPDGALAPPPPPNGPSRLDPTYAEKLLGPVPGMPDKQELHTNHDGDEPKARCAPRRQKSRPQRRVSVRLRQKVQALPRGGCVAGLAERA